MNNIVDRASSFTLLKEGRTFYRGNIHCHSTFSDGALSPDELKELYKREGYSFLSITDHDTYHDYRDELDEDGFVTIPGAEYALGWYGNTKHADRVHHLIALKYEDVSYPEGHRAYRIFPTTDNEHVRHTEELINELKRSGFLVMYNHPGWSRVYDDHILSLSGLDFLEIYNYGTILDTNNGYDNLTWQRMLDSGRRINAVADDDNHNSPSSPSDSAGGWVCVQADSLEKKAILDAMLEGRYYSSSGPEIREFRIEEGRAYIRTSPVLRIYLKYGVHVHSARVVFDHEGSLIEEAVFEIPEDAAYIRVEAVLDQDHMAWSNPIYFK